MTESTVYLFPDTNLFIQCKPLDELDWSAWADFDAIVLIVSRPVMREIDNHKNKGNERLGKRARSASSLFRRIVTGNQDHEIVRDTGPRVKLVIQPEHGHTEGLSELNYDERDDQLIGTVHEFAATYPHRDVRLLTHDTTPLATARSLGLRADVVPDDWLLPPERTETDKKIAALEAENVRLRKAEPSFQVTCQDSEGVTVERIDASYTWFEPLTDAEVNGLMQSLKDRFPIESDFGSEESVTRDVRAYGSFLADRPGEYVPATDEEIAAYRDKAYPGWLERCEKILRDYHHELQREEAMPVVTFVARNNGTRPAKDARITIEARGNFETMPPARDDQNGDGDEGNDRHSASDVSLPHPPTAPHGRWRTTSPVGGLGSNLESFDMMRRSLGGLPGMSDPFRSPLGYDSGLLDAAIYRPQSHDPNAFYYRPQRPMTPRSAFNLECDQWRHDDDDETFPAEICFPRGQDSVAGALKCRIQAENLSQAAVCLAPVRISVKQASSSERAQELVKNLTALPQISLRPAEGKSGSTG